MVKKLIRGKNGMKTEGFEFIETRGWTIFPLIPRKISSESGFRRCFHRAEAWEISRRIELLSAL